MDVLTNEEERDSPLPHRTRVLYVDHAPIIGGAELSLLELVETLDSQYEPAVVCTDTCPDFVRMLSATRAEVFVSRMPRIRGVLWLAALMQCVTGLRRLIRQFEPDIVHSNTVRTHIVSAIAARLCRVRVVWTVRDFTFPIWLYRLLVGLVDRVICVSCAIERVYGTGRVSKKASVVLNGILVPPLDISAERARIRSEYGIPENAPLVVSVGHLVPLKGQRYLLQAALAVNGRIPDARFILVGEEQSQSYADELKELASETALNGSVIFAGFRHDALSYMCASDLVAHTSVEAESFGRVLVEAMALGKPLIASPYGGPAEVIEDGVSGLLVTPTAVDELADAIVNVLTDADLADKLSRGGRARFEECFDQKRETEAVQGVYNDILGPSRQHA